MAKPVIKYKSFMGVDPRTDQPMLRVMICDRVVRHTEEMADALIRRANPRRRRPSFRRS
ncbi:MAG: hypothetical protein II649_07095 [Kiritimatiellae bacterium]|nr:hypothetical protein [Kiritimatiellia bacterium]